MSSNFTDPDCLQSHFDLPGPITLIEEYGAGHINDSYLVQGESNRYLLQRINTDVFQDVESVMENIERVTSHLAAMRSQSETVVAGWRILSLVRTSGGSTFDWDDNGDAWRMFHFVAESKSIERAASASQLYQAAFAFGHFQHCLRSLPEPPLKETIARFHDTPWRFEKLQQAIDTDDYNRARHCGDEIRQALSLATWSYVLTNAFAQGELSECVVHNDTKLNNVLFDEAAQRAICVVDLDTVMPGLAPYDFGDLVRSALPRASEADKGPVELPRELFRQIADGFISGAESLSAAETDHLASSAVVMALEVGVRFLTDYLEGDRYFKTSYDNHNLVRAGAQLNLASRLAECHEDFSQIVASLTR